MPTRLAFDRDCLMILQRNLYAVQPDEGCALLLGESVYPATSGIWLIVRLIWPCCNVWPAPKSSRQVSRQARFALDPREQIQAQRWARRKGLRVLGSAHSHSNKSLVPSETDRCLASAGSLMVILDGRGAVAGWFWPGPPLRWGNTLPILLGHWMIQTQTLN